MAPSYRAWTIEKLTGFMAPKSLEKSAERAEDCFADWEGAKATAEPAIRERRATVFMVDSSCFFDFVEIEANKRARNDEGASWLADGKGQRSRR